MYFRMLVFSSDISKLSPLAIELRCWRVRCWKQGLCRTSTLLSFLFHSCTNMNYYNSFHDCGNPIIVLTVQRGNETIWPQEMIERGIKYHVQVFRLCVCLSAIQCMRFFVEVLINTHRYGSCLVMAYQAAFYC